MNKIYLGNDGSVIVEMIEQGGPGSGRKPNGLSLKSNKGLSSNYKKHLGHLKNVRIIDSSPRNSGEKEINSDYKEIKNIPNSFNERVPFIKDLAEKHEEVVVKSATGYGGARIFVKHKKNII